MPSAMESRKRKRADDVVVGQKAKKVYKLRSGLTSQIATTETGIQKRLQTEGKNDHIVPTESSQSQSQSKRTVKSQSQNRSTVQVNEN